MLIRCEWCGQPSEAEEWEGVPSEAEDDEEEEVYEGLCVVCQLQLGTTGTLQTYQDPTLVAMVEDIQQRRRDPRGGA